MPLMPNYLQTIFPQIIYKFALLLSSHLDMKGSLL